VEASRAASREKIRAASKSSL